MTDDFFRSCLDQMIDPRHRLAVLAQRRPWAKIEARLAPQFSHQARPFRQIEEAPDLLGAVVSIKRRQGQQRRPAPSVHAPDGRPQCAQKQL